MSQREKMLGGGVALVILLWSANWLVGTYRDAMSAAEARLATAQQSVADSELKEAKGKYAMKRLIELREKSLPRNVGVAQSQYRTWLVDKLSDARIKVADIIPSRGQSSSTFYETLAYTVEAEGNLEAVVKFLAAFYGSDQLHKINQLVLRPIGKGGALRVSLSVEAMLLKDADRESGLNDVPSDRLALTDTGAYVDSIVGRNLFEPYVPPPPPRPPRPPVVRTERKPPPPPPPKPKFDDSEHAFVTAIVQSGDKLQAWINVRTTGELLRVKAGDPFEVGLMSGEIRDVTAKRLVLQTADNTLLEIDLGDSLRDGQPPLPSGGI